jgi:aspartate/methionine/tyrosine aminotransferase
MPSLSSTAGAMRPGVFADLQRHIELYAARGGDLISLHIGDSYLDPPQAARFGSIIERHGADDELYRYGAVTGLDALRDAIADELRGHARAMPDIEGRRHILIGAGATHALSCAARVILAPGDDVLLLAPYWPLAHGIIQATGARAVEVPFTNRLYKDPSLGTADILREALTPKTRAIYLITPNNPDGKVLTREQLAGIAAVAIEKDLWVIADECYADFTFGVPHISIASSPGMAERTISAYSFSKSHALAGARVGYVVAPPELVAAAQRISTHTVFNVPVLMQLAAAAALQAGPRWTERALLIYRHSLDASIEAFKGSKIRFSPAEGGAYLFLDFSEVLEEKPLSLLLQRAIDRGVLIAPGEAFGQSYAKWGRLCFTAAPLPRLLEGIARLRTAVDLLHAPPGSTPAPPSRRGMAL